MKRELKFKTSGRNFRCMFEDSSIPNWQIENHLPSDNAEGEASFFTGGFFAFWFIRENNAIKEIKFCLNNKIYSSLDENLHVILQVRDLAKLIFELRLEHEGSILSQYTYVSEALSWKILDPTFDTIDLQEADVILSFYESYLLNRRNTGLKYDFGIQSIKDFFPVIFK